MIAWPASHFGSASLMAGGAICLISLGGWIGAGINGWRWEARYAAREAEIHQERITAYETARALEAAGDLQAKKLLAQEAENRKLGKERDDAIRKLATGRACLGADLVGLLNAGAAPGPGLSAPAGGLAYPAAAAATDTDVALWARNAREQYDLCRARIDALIEWSETLK